MLSSALLSGSALVGTWVFTHLIQETPQTQIAPPTPGLIMTFEFKEDGTNILHYYKKGDSSACTRTATFSYANNQLVQNVTDIDANNAPFCSDDPDMQGGKETTTPLEIKDDQLLMTLTLGDQKIIYVWQPCDNNTPGKACEDLVKSWALQ